MSTALSPIFWLNHHNHVSCYHSKDTLLFLHSKDSHFSSIAQVQHFLCAMSTVQPSTTGIITVQFEKYYWHLTHPNHRAYTTVPTSLFLHHHAYTTMPTPPCIHHHTYTTVLHHHADTTMSTPPYLHHSATPPCGHHQAYTTLSTPLSLQHHAYTAMPTPPCLHHHAYITIGDLTIL